MYTLGKLLSVAEQILRLLPLLSDLLWYSFAFFLITGSGYFLISGSLYWLFFGRPRKDPQEGNQKEDHHRKKQSQLVSLSALRSDMVLSIYSTGIFAVCAAIMTLAYQQGHTRLYLNPYQHGLSYIPLSFVVVLFLQDTYFYFTHRLAHHPKCYRWLHQGHHQSKNPTPWTAFAFDPGEALLQAIYLMAAVYFIPMHITVLCAVVLTMSLGALLHHVSLQLFVPSAVSNWFGNWLVGPSHHWYHHRRFTRHYSLYFTFWDKVLGTQEDGYVAWISSLTHQFASSDRAAPLSTESKTTESKTTESKSTKSQATELAPTELTPAEKC